MLGRDGRVLLSRKGVGRRLGITYSAVRRLQESEALTPVRRAPDRSFQFDQVDVDRVERERAEKRPRASASGDVAADAYERFLNQETQVEVVIALRQPPSLVRALWESFCDSHGPAVPSAVRKHVDAMLAEAGLATNWDEDLIPLFEHLLKHLLKHERAALARALDAAASSAA